MLARRSFDFRCDAWEYAENEIGASFNFPRSDHTSRVTLQRNEIDAQSQAHSLSNPEKCFHLDKATRLFPNYRV